MNKRSSRYFQAKKAYKLITRPLSLANKIIVGSPGWQEQFIKALELATIALNHLNGSLYQRYKKLQQEKWEAKTWASKSIKKPPYV